MLGWVMHHGNRPRVPRWSAGGNFILRPIICHLHGHSPSHSDLTDCQNNTQTHTLD